MAFRLTVDQEVDRVGRGRKKTIRLHFELLTVRTISIPVEWLTDPEKLAVIVELRRWKVTDKHIALYLAYVELARVWKLIREWRKKNESNLPIQDRVKYCNAAFVREAKLTKEHEEADALEVRKMLQSTLSQ